MKKSAFLGACALLLSGQASANYVGVVTGADMLDMQVTVTYTDSSSESQVWQAFEQDASVDYLEGFSGGVNGTGWSLIQRGDTISQTPPNTSLPLGLWTFSFENLGLGIESVFINALSGGFVFDTETGDDSANGSSGGRGFTVDDGVDFVNYSYTNNVEDELFGGLLLEGINAPLFSNSGSLEFLIDTDQISSATVSAPATLGVFTMGIALLGFTRRNVK